MTFSGSVGLGYTEETGTNETPSNQQALFVVDRKTNPSPRETSHSASHGIDSDNSESSSDAVTPAVVTNDKSGDAASSSDESDSSNEIDVPMNVKDDAAQSSDTSDDEVIFNVSATKRSATKSTPLRSKAHAGILVKKTPGKGSKGTGKTLDKNKGSTTPEPCLRQTDKENRLTQRSNRTPVNTTVTRGAKSTPRRATKTVGILTVLMVLNGTYVRV